MRVTSTPSTFWIRRKARRPIRPKPLIPTLTTIRDFLLMKIKKIFCEKSNLTQRQTSFNSLYYILYCIKKQLFPHEKQDLS